MSFPHVYVLLSAATVAIFSAAGLKIGRLAIADPDIGEIPLMSELLPNQIVLVPHAWPLIRIGTTDFIQHWMALGHSKRSTHSGGPQLSDGAPAIVFASSASCSEILIAESCCRHCPYDASQSVKLVPSEVIPALSALDSSSPSGIK